MKLCWAERLGKVYDQQHVWLRSRWEPLRAEAVPGDHGDTQDCAPFQISSSGLPCFLDGKMVNFIGKSDTPPSWAERSYQVVSTPITVRACNPPSVL